MIQNQELKIVKKLANANDKQRIVLNEAGWTSRVYLVDDGKFVFKFLKSKKYQKELEHEINILRLLKEYKFNLKIPLLHCVGKNNAYAGFCGIAGKSMTTEVIDELSEAQKRKIGAQIGLFLKQLHAIDYNGESPNNENDAMDWLQKSFRKRKHLLKKYFNDGELGIIEKLVTSFPQKAVELGAEQVFCHCDLGYNNILLTRNIEVGIIDFGDAGIYEKSQDFAGLEDDIILDSAIIAYGGDKILREKIAIRRQLLPLMEMLFLFDRKDSEGAEKCAQKIKSNLKIEN